MQTRKAITPEARFDSQWRLLSTGCMEWIGGSLTQAGYGMFKANGRSVPAHRWNYERKNKVCLLPHIDACHSCDFRLCVNDLHVFPGTRLDNMRDAASKGRMSHAPKVFGEQHPCTNLKEPDVLAIRRRREQGDTLISIASVYGLSASTVSRIALRKTWKHVAHV